jgi:hypothetical protein
MSFSSTTTLERLITLPLLSRVAATTTGILVITLTGRKNCHGVELTQEILRFTFLPVAFSGIFACKGVEHDFIFILGSIDAGVTTNLPFAGIGKLFSINALANCRMYSLSKCLAKQFDWKLARNKNNVINAFNLFIIFAIYYYRNINTRLCL